jgi:hypothetical protein
MAFDQELADRIRALIDDRDPVEKRMFGGLAFMVAGKMAIVASGQGGAMVRVNPDESDSLCEQAGVAPMIMKGKPMKGWLRIDVDQLDEDKELRAWVDRGVAAAATA